MQVANESSSKADSEGGKRPPRLPPVQGWALAGVTRPSPGKTLTPANLNANLVQITEHRRAKTEAELCARSL